MKVDACERARASASAHTGNRTRTLKYCGGGGDGDGDGDGDGARVSVEFDEACPSRAIRFVDHQQRRCLPASRLANRRYCRRHSFASGYSHRLSLVVAAAAVATATAARLKARGARASRLPLVSPAVILIAAVASTKLEWSMHNARARVYSFAHCPRRARDARRAQTTTPTT